MISITAVCVTSKELVTINMEDYSQAQYYFGTSEISWAEIKKNPSNIRLFLNFCRAIGVEDVPESLLISDPDSMSIYFSLCDAVAKVEIGDDFVPKSFYVPEENEEKENVDMNKEEYMKKANEELAKEVKELEEMNNKAKATPVEIFHELIEEAAQQMAEEADQEVAANVSNEEVHELFEENKVEENNDMNDTVKQVQGDVEDFVNASTGKVKNAFAKLAELSGDLKKAFIQLNDMDAEDAYESAIGDIDDKIARCSKYIGKTIEEKTAKLRAEKATIDSVMSKVESMCATVDEKTKKGIIGKVRTFLGVIFKAVAKVLKATGKFLFHTAVIVGTFTLRVVGFTGKEAVGAGKAVGKAFKDDIVNEFRSEDAEEEKADSKLKKFTDFVIKKFRLNEEEETVEFVDDNNVETVDDEVVTE